MNVPYMNDTDGQVFSALSYGLRSRDVFIV